jgi:hypothetical protein
MKSIHTEIQIDARLETVWHVLTDFAAYSAWNPVIPGIKGDARIGAEIRFRIHLDRMPVLPITAHIARCERESVLSWTGGRSPVFSGEHWVRISSPTEGTTRLEHGEDFEGLISRAMGRWVLDRIQTSYETLNAALKRRAESLAQKGA